jgi:hypothetical protein
MIPANRIVITNKAIACITAKVIINNPLNIEAPGNQLGNNMFNNPIQPVKKDQTTSLIFSNNTPVCSIVQGKITQSVADTVEQSTPKNSAFNEFESLSLKVLFSVTPIPNPFSWNVVVPTNQNTIEFSVKNIIITQTAIPVNWSIMTASH